MRILLGIRESLGRLWSIVLHNGSCSWLQTTNHIPQTTDHRPPHRPQTTDHRPQTTYHRPQITNHRPQTTDHPPQTTSHRPKAKDHRPESTHHRPQTKDHQPHTTAHSPHHTTLGGTSNTTHRNTQQHNATQATHHCIIEHSIATLALASTVRKHGMRRGGGGC